MGLWASVKAVLRKIIPAGRTYTDNKFSDLKKQMDKQAKLLDKQQKILDKQQKLLVDIQKGGQNQIKAIESVKQYVDQELKRRDDWGKRAAETARMADGRQVWVIKCPAPEDYIKIRWGDYSYAMSLKRYLERMNIYVILDTREDWGCEEGADVVLVLRGKFFYRPDRRNEKCVYIMWNISHPDMVTKEEYELYDAVCVASLHHTEKLKKELRVPVFPLLQCTDTELFYPAEKAQGSVNYASGSGEERSEDRKAAFGAEENPSEGRKWEYIFIGNSRGIARSCVVWSVEKNIPLRIWGSGWDKILADHMDLIEAPFIENSEIPALYRSAKATLNDHWKDMLDNQFVNNRIFDALACGLPVISDGCDELRAIFPDAVLYYENKEEFEECLRRIEEDYDAVKETVKEQWDMIREKYSFEARAKELVEIAERYKR